MSGVHFRCSFFSAHSLVLRDQLLQLATNYLY